MTHEVDDLFGMVSAVAAAKLEGTPFDEFNITDLVPYNTINARAAFGANAGS